MLLSLNYANTVGLFQIKSSLPAQFFATQVEALVDGIYAAPEEMTIRYSGPNTCYWDGNLSEWRCQGDIRIKSVGASASFTHNSVTLGFPATGCIYIDLLPVVWRKAKGEELIQPKASKNVRKSMTLENSPREVAVVLEGLDEAEEEALEEGLRNVFKKLKAGDELTDEEIELLNNLRRRTVEEGKGSEKTFLEYWREKRWTLERGEPRRHDFFEVLEACMKDADCVSGKGYLYKKIEKQLAPVVEKIAEARSIREKFGKEAMIAFLEKGYIPRKHRMLGTAKKVLSKLSTVKKIYDRTVRTLTMYASCRSDNILLDLVDLLMNGQIILETDNKIIHHFYDFYVGKTGAVSLKYVQAGREREINKLMVLNGEDMCFQRHFLSYNLTDYEFTNFPVKDGAIELSKERKLFDTLCDENNRYYPRDLFDIIETIKQVEKDGQTRTITVFVNPGKMISKEGTKLCERRVKRTEDGRFNGSFVIFCYQIPSLIGRDFNLTINYDNPEEEILPTGTADELIKKEGGNEYWFASPPIIEGRFKIDSPALTFGSLLGLGVRESIFQIPYEVGQGVTKWISPRTQLPRKEAYFQSRYDMYELTIGKKPFGGSWALQINVSYKGMVLGMDYDGIYTEAQLK